MRYGFFKNVPKKLGDLLILRHAKSDHNLKQCCAGQYNDSQPTKEGIQETLKIGQKLRNNQFRFDTVYTSPLKRAIATKEALLKEFPPIRAYEQEALAERHFGAFTGMSKDEIKSKLSPESFYSYLYNKDFFPPDIDPEHKYFRSQSLYGVWPHNHKGESYQCVINRLSPFLQKIRNELLAGQNILIIGHSHNLQLLQMILYEKPFEHGLDKFQIEYVKPIQFIFSQNENGQLIVKEKIQLFKNENFVESLCKQRRE